MKPSTTIARVIRDIFAPYTVALSRTIAHFNSQVTTAVTTTQENVATVQQIADTAQTYATSAQSSATDSATSATASKQSSTDAAASAAASTAVLKSFNQRWLGDHDTDPTTDGNGNALADGAEYYNTSTGRIRVYSTANGWVDISQADLSSVSSAQASAAAAAASEASAKTYATNAQTSEANAQNYADQAKASYTATLAVGIPAANSSLIGYIPVVNQAGDSYELLSPAQFLSSVGAAPADNANLTGSAKAPDISDWAADTSLIINQRSLLNYLSNNYSTNKQLTTTLGGYVTTDQLTTATTTWESSLSTTLAGYVATPLSTSSSDYPVSSAGINKTTGMPWLKNGATGAYLSVYPTTTIDAKFQNYIPLTGGKLIGAFALSLSGSSVSYSTNSVNFGAELSDASWSTNVGFYLGVSTDSSGLANSNGILRLVTSKNVAYQYQFSPTSITTPGGLILATTKDVQIYAQPVGDYATNDSLTTKTSALQTALNTLSGQTVVTVPSGTTQTKITNFYRDTSVGNNGTAGICATYTSGTSTAVVNLADVSYTDAKYQPVGDYLTSETAASTYLPLSGGSVGALSVASTVTVSDNTQGTASVYVGGILSSTITGRGTTGTYGPVTFSLSPIESQTDLYGQLSLTGYGSRYDTNFHKSGDITTTKGTVIQSSSGLNAAASISAAVSSLTNQAGTFTFDVEFSKIPSVTPALIGGNGTLSIVSVTTKGVSVVTTSTTGTINLNILGTI